MAHELAKNAKTGRLSYVGQRKIVSAWHREGFDLDHAPSFEETAKLAGWDYEIETINLCGIMPPGYSCAKEFQAVVRKDTKLVMAVMGEGYQFYNNRDAFSVVIPLLDKGLAEIATSGTLRDGADAWLMLQLNIDNPIVREVYAGDIIPYSLIANNHTGQARVIYRETPQVVVCANTLNMSARNKVREIRVKHTSNVKQKALEVAMDFYEGMIERHVQCATQYKMLKATRLSEQEFVDSVLDLIAPLPDPESKFFERAVDKRSTLKTRWTTTGIGISGERTAWDAYMSVTQTVDHDSDIYRMNKNKETGKENSRVEALIDGRLAKVKDTVLDSLLDLCYANAK